MAGETDPKVTENINVLVVEDEGIIARDISRILQGLGYTVAGIASSGAEALALATQSTLDLVLMDIRIKGDMDGIRAAEQMRQRHGVPVVYLTAHADNMTIERAKESEPYGYVVKPFTSDDLRIAVEMAVKRRMVQRRIEEREAWLAEVLRSMADGVIVNSPDGRITFSNNAAEQLIGAPRVKIYGAPIQDALQIRCQGEALLAARLDDDSPSVQPTQYRAGTLQCQDGSQKLVISSSSPVRRAQKPEGPFDTVTILRDISDLRETERVLRENDEWVLRLRS